MKLNKNDPVINSSETEAVFHTNVTNTFWKIGIIDRSPNCRFKKIKTHPMCHIGAKNKEWQGKFWNEN